MGGLSMDQAFVQAPEHRPKAVIAEAAGIPVIDLSPLAAGDQAGVEALAAEVGRASRQWGFFVVVRHGVPDDTMHGAGAGGPEGVFRDAGGAEGRRAEGRGGAARVLRLYESEHTKNVRDWKEVFDFVPREPPPPSAVTDGELVFENKWPQDLPGFREALEEYAKAMEELALKLLELIARSLQLRLDRLQLEELVSDDSPPRYEPYNWGVFFRTKRNSNFKKLAVENVQIAHFRKDLKSIA